MIIDWQKKCKADLKPIGKLLWYTRAVKIHKDGDGATEVYYKWHPLTWLMFLALIPVCAMVGERIGDVVRFKVEPYWDDKLDNMEWLKH